MGFFSTLLGRSDDRLASLRKSVQRRAWAETLATAAGVECSALTSAESTEFEELVTLAGDELARLNLFEGDALTRSGEHLAANDHYSLALGQARSPELVAAIRLKLQPGPIVGEILPPPQTDLHRQSACTSGHCAVSLPADSAAESFLTREERLELIVTGLPQGVADHYRQLHGPLLEAVFLAHEDRSEEALASFSQVPTAAQNVIFFFERGGLLARNGDLAGAAQDLQHCLVCDATFLLAQESLVDLYLLMKEDTRAECLLDSPALAPAFVHARMARIQHTRGAVAEALSQALLALANGSRDPELRLLVASIYEERGELALAEQHLLALGGAGCAGGNDNIPLAEFRLRHLRDLAGALEGFKAAARREPDNSFWWLRIGQTYLRLGWVREGKPLLAKVAAASTADERVRALAQEELQGL